MKQFVEQLCQRGLYLRVADGRLLLEGDEGFSDEELDLVKNNAGIILFIKEHKDELIEYVSELQDSLSAGEKDEILSVYPLSGLQEGMLFHGLFDDQAGGYIEQLTCDLIDVREELLLEGWNYVLQCHSILRSSFHYDEYNIPVQSVHRVIPMPFERTDLRGMTAPEQEKAFREYQLADRRRGIDLTVAPLMRIGLVKLDERRTRMLWTHHHILTDGWSMQIMIEELLQAYEGLMEGRSLVVAGVDNYEDYIRYIRSKDKRQEELYWRSHFEGIDENCQLPFVYAVKERNMGVGVYEEQYIRTGSAVARDLTAYARQNGLTLNTVMQGIWAYLLSCYTGKTDVFFGVTVSGRPDDMLGIERRVGLYINTIPLCVRVAPEQKVAEWLRTLQLKHVQSREFQYSSLNGIQDWLKLPGDLFDSLLVYENFPESRVTSSRKWLLQTEGMSMQDHVNYPMSIRVVASAEEITLRFSYNAGMLGHRDVTMVAEHFRHLLLQMAENPDRTVASLNLLPGLERVQLLERYGVSSVVYPRDRTVVELFEAEVRKAGGVAAVVFGDEEVSYGELNERANRLAHYLRECGVKKGMPVALCMDRSVSMLVGVLGVLKAGGAYVPVDRAYPGSRIRYMLEDIGSPVVITEGGLAVEAGEGIRFIDLERDGSIIAGYPAGDPAAVSTAEDLAYIIYTSGSTGQPKGVMVRHGNIIDYVYGLAGVVPMRDCRSFALVSGLTTDLGNTVVYGSLLTGGTLHLLPGVLVNDEGGMGEYFRRHRIDCLKIVPSHWKALSAGGHPLVPLRLLIFGGEVLSAEVIERVRSVSPECRIVNHYGPTETTVGKLLHVVESGRVYADTIPIGRPFSNTRVYILSKAGSLCPLGVPGELYIGGEGVAAGYWKQPGLTSERFVADPFSKRSGARMYRTGDVCRWEADGNVRYLGRQDDQVKVRGFRVEPGEIGTILEQHEQVRQAVVVARPDGAGSNQLIGYVVAEGVFDREAVVRWLQERLPEHMVPAWWVVMPEMPLTGNGKVDRKRLPDPDVSEQLAGQYVAPRTAVERALAAIWQELLGMERIGVNDNFFKLGGHSLLATRVLSAIRRDFSISISIRILFEFRTIEVLAKYLELELSKQTFHADDLQQYTMLEI